MERTRYRPVVVASQCLEGREMVTLLLLICNSARVFRTDYTVTSLSLSIKFRCKKKHEKIEMAGFSCPENAQDEDLRPWIPSENSELLNASILANQSVRWYLFCTTVYEILFTKCYFFPAVKKVLTLEMSKYILKNVGDEFCNLVKQEKEAQSWSVKKGKF